MCFPFSLSLYRVLVKSVSERRNRTVEERETKAESVLPKEHFFQEVTYSEPSGATGKKKEKIQRLDKELMINQTRGLLKKAPNNQIFPEQEIRKDAE